VLKFVHASDLHLDSPLTGLLRYPGAPVEQIRGATRRALTHLVELCEQEQACLLLLAGDLFDGDWRDYNTGLFFANAMARLKRAGVQVVLVRGNHDAMSQITRYLTLPSNVVELSHKAPQTQIYPDWGIAVHGQSYARRAETTDLAAGYPDALPGLVNIGLLHTSAGGRAGHENYAPCNLTTLLSKGYDYWALGHVHQREVLHERPWVVFAGNLQGRHVRELGPKGATLVTLQDGQIHNVEHRSLDVVRWERCEVSASDEREPEQLVEKVGHALSEMVESLGDRVLVARVVVTGQTAAHAELMREPERWEAATLARAAEVDRVWVESVRFETSGPVSSRALEQRGDALGQVARRLQTLRENPSELSKWLGALDDLKHKLPPEVRQGVLASQLDDPTLLSELVADVEQQLLSRLLALGESAHPSVGGGKGVSEEVS
jgi:DNA repair exonuclease SbcCD nuclease subunit